MWVHAIQLRQRKERHPQLLRSLLTGAPIVRPARALLVEDAQLLTPPTDGPITLDAAKLGRELAKRLFDEMVSDNELFMYHFG